MNKYKKLISNLLIFTIGTVGSKLVLFFLVPLYTRVLSKDQYGIADLVVTIGNLVTPILSLTIYDALFRFGFMKDSKVEDVLNVTFVIILFGTISTIALTPLLSFYKAVSNYKWYLCAYVISSILSQSTLLYLKVKEMNKAYSILCIVQALILVLSNIVFLIILKKGIVGYLLSTIISLLFVTLCSIMVGHVFSDIKKSKFSKKLAKNMLKYSIPLIISNISWWIIHSSDKIMIELILDDSSLGLYTAAARIPSILNVFITVFIQAWTLASINEYESTNDKTFYSNMFNFFQILILLICLVIIALIKPFMSIYVGEEYFESWIYVPLLLLSSCLSGFTSFFGTFYTITQKSKDVMITTIIASIINVIFNYIFMMLIGVWGAVIGTIASYFVITIIRMVDVYKEFKFSYHLKSLILNFSIVSLTIILIIFDVNIYICSIIAIIVYCILNFKSIKNLTEFMVKNLKMYFKKFFKEKV